MTHCTYKHCVWWWEFK